MRPTFRVPDVGLLCLFPPAARESCAITTACARFNAHDAVLNSMTARPAAYNASATTLGSLR